MSFLASLEDLTLCAWPVASMAADELERAEAAANAHADAALVMSCQRVEAYHCGPCGCEAPLRARGVAALIHFAEVAAGLHSVVLGEDQVLGQVRSALDGAPPLISAAGAVGVSAARVLRAETAFDSHTGHMVDRALAAANVSPAGRTIGIVGAGAVGRLAVERAINLRFERITVVARRDPRPLWGTPSQVDYLQFDGAAGSAGVDVLVTCLGRSAGSLDASSLPGIGMLAIDLGTPRNIGCELDVPVLRTRDLLPGDAETGLREGLKARLKTILDLRIELAERTSESPLGRFRHEIERVRREEVARAARLRPDVSPEAIDTITRSLVNRMFHLPTERLRASDDPAFERAVVALFAADRPTLEVPK